MIKFSRQFLENLSERLSLAELIGKKVRLTRRGKEFTGLCPFHKEKTPSFTINDEEGFYHCFGCGAHGNIFDWVRNHEKMSFAEAVEYLAGVAGVPVPVESAAEKERYQKQTSLMTLMEEACLFFQQQLARSVEAQEYLKKRGITEKIAAHFRLGYAPKSDALITYLTKKGFTIADCLELGLCRIAENRRPRDFFFHRIMFPIFTRSGKVNAFGGRLLEKGEPKYLNSPDTPLFNKGKQLFTPPDTLSHIAKSNSAILVEGYMDVISLQTAGFLNTVAPLGTALTPDQLQLLWKICDEPVICFDGDFAGQKAMERALDRALPLLKPGKSLQFLALPAGLDPDDIIQKQSKQAFADLLKTAKPCIQAFWEINTAGKDISTPERMAKLQDDILKKCETITNPIVAELYKKQMNKKLWALKNTKNKSKIKLQPIIAPQKNTFEGRMLVAYILTFPELAGQFLEQIMNLKVSEPFLATILNNVIPQVAENPDISREELCNQLTDKDKLFLKAELEILKDKDIFVATNEFKELLNFWQNKSAEEELETALKEYENNPTEEGWNNIMRLKQNL